MSVIETIGKLSKASPLFTLLSSMKTQIDNQSDANRVYEKLHPVLMELLDKGYAFESDEIQAIVALLAELPAFGARRRNFKKLYLKDEYALRRLPRDPRLLSRGVWH